jgi:hypothetical protein
MAVEEQTQRDMYMAARPSLGMSDQPNQNCPEESPDPTHLRPVDGSDPSHRYPPETFPLTGTSYETDGLGRKVMSPETESCMKWWWQNQEEGIKMRRIAARGQGVHNVHTLFGRTNTR